MRMSKVSVIMSVYNGGKYLEKAIESILNQTYKDFEFIIIDDGSTDGSPAIARRFAQRDKRITVLTQPNAGPAKARNTALQQARGEWLAFIDSDDIYLPDAIQKRRYWPDEIADRLSKWLPAFFGILG